MNNIEENEVDARAKLYRAISGVIPGGSFLVEYMIEKIPNQRMKRLFSFVEEINQRLTKLESTDFLSDPEYMRLAENSLIESTKPISRLRISWLASATIPLNIPDEKELEYRRKASEILASLTDSDIKYLLSLQDYETHFNYERSIAENHFISMDDVKNLPSDELFRKQLANERINIHQQSLKEKRLIDKEDDSSGFYHISTTGKLFIYTITGEYPRVGT